MPLNDTAKPSMGINDEENIHISFFEACFLILYFHACACIYETYVNELVFKPMTKCIIILF